MQKTAFRKRAAVIAPQPRQSLRLLTKTLLVMKLTILFLAFGILNAQAKTYSQTVTFSGKNVSLVKVFSAVEKQTGFSIFANKDLLAGVTPVSINAKDMPLKQFLDEAFKDQPISYEIENKTIFIKKKGTDPAAVTTTPVIADQEKPFQVITGTVKGSDGVELPGANISVKGTTTATATNASGHFSINAEPGSVLVISYIGYKTLEEPVKGRTTIDIVLQKTAADIDQVVVTALGITKKAKSLTYNVQEIKGDELNTNNDGSFVNSLNGKVAGATINASSAGPGSSSRVVMRGIKSISGNNNVLYVIDGIPMPNTIRGQAEDIFSGAGQTGDFISNINPEDIESVSILSGPSAAALYGSAAANGVILVTTKRGQKNRTDVSVMNTTTFSDPLILPKFQNEYGQSDIGSYYSWGAKLNTPSTYKPSDFFQTGVNVMNSVTLSTGTDKNQTYISVGNLTDKGIVPNNTYGRTNITARNTSVFLNDKITLDIGFMASLVNEQNMISQGQYFNPLIAVYLFPPGDDFNKVKSFARYDASRNLPVQYWPYGDNGFSMQNPFWVTQDDIFQNKKERYMTTLALKYNIAPWINVSGRVKMDKETEKDEKKFAASTNTLFASQDGYYSLNSLDTRQIYADGLVSINKGLGKDYNVSANLGTSIEDVENNQYLYGGKLQGVANLYTYGNVNRSNSR